MALLHGFGKLVAVSSTPQFVRLNAEERTCCAASLSIRALGTGTVVAGINYSDAGSGSFTSVSASLPQISAGTEVVFTAYGEPIYSLVVASSGSPSALINAF